MKPKFRGDFRPESKVETLSIQPYWLEMIKLGSKDLELRFNWGKAARVQRDQKLRLGEGENSLLVQIIDRREYKNIKEVLANEDVGRITPGKNKEQFMEMWDENPNSKKGLTILIFEIKVIKEAAS